MKGYVEASSKGKNVGFLEDSSLSLSFFFFSCINIDKLQFSLYSKFDILVLVLKGRLVLII